MNEDARDTDTPTGRALGTVVALGLTAAGVGAGIYGTYKTGKAVKEGFTKGAAKVKNLTRELTNNETIKLDNVATKLGDVQNVTIHSKPARRIRNAQSTGTASEALKYTNNLTNEASEAVPIKKSLKGYRRQRAQQDANREFMWENGKDKLHGSLKEFMAEQDKLDSFVETGGHMAGADALTKKKIHDNAEKKYNEIFSDQNMAYYDRKIALNNELKNSSDWLGNENYLLDDWNSYDMSINMKAPNFKPKQQTASKTKPKGGNNMLSNEQIIKNAGLNPNELTAEQQQQVLNIEKNKNKEYKGIIGIGKDGNPIYR